MKYIMMMGLLLAAIVSVLAVGNRVDNFGTEDATKSIHGQVLYQEQTKLPPQALLIVDLLDVTVMDAPRKIVAQSVVEVADQHALVFSLPLTHDALEADHTYALAARILVGDALWFTNGEPLAVERDRDGYLIRLEPVNFSTSPLTSSLKGQEWLAERIDGDATIEPLPSLIIEDMSAKEHDVTGEGRADLFTNRYEVVGTGSCNRYFSTAVLDEENNKLQFSPLGMTFMACIDAVMHQENRFVNMMSHVRSYQIEEGGILYLMDEAGDRIARFSAKF